MGVLLNVFTSSEAARWAQDSTLQTITEGSLKAVSRPAFTLIDKNAEPEAKKYSASKEVIFQTLSMMAYFALITTVFQKGGYKLLKKMPKFKDYDVLKNINTFEEFGHTFSAYTKGRITTSAKQAEQLEKTKGAMELIKMLGSGIILTILCPFTVTKLVHPIMQALNLEKKGSSKASANFNKKTGLDVKA